MQHVMKVQKHIYKFMMLLAKVYMDLGNTYSSGWL